MRATSNYEPRHLCLPAAGLLDCDRYRSMFQIRQLTQMEPRRLFVSEQ